LAADLVGAGPVQVGLADRLQPPAHGRVGGPGRPAASGQDAAVGLPLLGDGAGAPGPPPGPGGPPGALLGGGGTAWSAARSGGAGWSGQDAETTTSRARPSRVARVDRDRSRSLTQTLRP